MRLSRNHIKKYSEIKRLLVFVFSLMNFFSFLSQDKELVIELDWQEKDAELIINEKQTLKAPHLPGASFDSDQYVWVNHFDRPANSNRKLSFKDVELVSITKTDKNFIEHFNLNIPEDINYKVKNINARNEAKLGVEIIPYVKEGSDIKRIKKIRFTVETITTISAKSNHIFADESVLKEGSGEWYKIKVSETGVYKVDYAFLEEIGVDMSKVKPESINIYGNGFGRLPETNDEYRPDDLIKNAIHIQGAADGSFDEGDYILFYGRGPHRWEKDGTRFKRILNNYAEHSAYFININTAETPLRITNTQLSTLEATHTVSDYNSFAIHQTNKVNLLKGGQRWYGELFDANLTQSFSFNIPNVNTNSSGIVRAFMACREGSSGGGTNFKVHYNSNLIGESSFPISGSDSYRRSGFTSTADDFSPTSSAFTLDVTFNRQNPSDHAYLDFIEINTRSHLRYSNRNLIFRDIPSTGVGNVSLFQIDNFPTGGIVWEVTELGKTKSVNGTINAGKYEFKVATDSLRTFVAFTQNNVLTPTFDEKISHQNLHSLEYADYLIVTHPLFLTQANRLAQLHSANGLSVHVVDLEKIYNEFSGGTQDPTAIKFFAKMFYDRSEGNPDKMPKHMCLFGDGTYDPLDRVPNNNYMCPVYHTLSSEGYVSTLLSDDYFGFLDDEESFSPSDVLDINIGRLVATTEEHAIDLINKIEHYMKNGSDLFSGRGVPTDENGFISKHGDWRLRYTGIADDRENGYFIINDLEPAYEYVKENHPKMNAVKIYSDAFELVSTAGGRRYPDVNKAINRSIASGTLMMCYVGHGGATGAAQERIITIGQINDWRNIDKLTLFASATCEFARIDDNERVSAGEWMALNPLGGAIALMTTTRAVYFSTNSLTTASFFRNVFDRDNDRKPQTFGEIITKTKNEITQSSNNKRSFMLLGDPALSIALPYEKVVLDSLNGVSLASTEIDTLKALSKMRLSGHLEDQFGNKLNNFNGIMQPSVFDKPEIENTLEQHSTSPYIEFEQQNNVLYRGRVSVKNGAFDFDFIVPKDINYTFGNGKASFYANNDMDLTAGGYNSDIIVGGVDTTGLDDTEGPEIELFLNDENFVNGGLTNETPLLIAYLFDESGINTVGTGIGHDITAIIDGETSSPIVLNDYYEADLDTYQSGSVRFQLDGLEAGPHTLTFKAWDVNNNSSEETIEFTVREQSDLMIQNVFNYPNPFTTKTSFMFEHNQPTSSLETHIEIYTVTGRLVKTIMEDVKTTGFRVDGIQWDGKDEFGDQLAKGVYVYRVRVRNVDGETAQAMQKLYLLK